MSNFYNLVSDVVNNNINNKIMFTAFDVTAELRKKNKFKIMHNDVKNVVRTMFESGHMGNYQSTLGNFPNVNVQPWIYHDTLSNPLNYKNNQSSVPDPVATAPLYTSPSIDNSLPGDDDAYEVDARGTLCIPAKLIRNAGLNKRDKAYVHVDFLDSKLFLDKDANGAVSVYTVDGSNNVRVTKKTLDRAGMLSTKYKIDFKDFKVIVTLS